MTSAVVVRPLTKDDTTHVQRILYLAVSWNNPPGIPPIDVAAQHPELHRYHTGWGRHGDLGCAAELDGEFLGGAFCRLFTAEDHGHGYVAEDVPELAIGVAAGSRGRGIGTRLMEGIAATAAAAGMRRLSLSVNKPNPAVKLYERLGYTTLNDDGESLLMVLDLTAR